MASGFDAASRLLDTALAARAFPGAAVEVGTSTGVLWTHAAGRLTFDPAAPSVDADTIFDLASLTKVLATTPLLLQQVEQGAVGLDDPVADHVAAWRLPDRRDVTLRDLLSHASGLPAHRPYYLQIQGLDAYVGAIAGEPLEYAPRSASVYSDLGFILLGAIAGGAVGLDVRMTALVSQLGIADPLGFTPHASWLRRIAPTAIDEWRGGRLLVGEVDDQNAAALGGVAGHAGLFGTAAAVGTVARHLLQVLEGRTGVVRRETLLTSITRRLEVPGSSRALGWDTALPTSSCGPLMSPTAFGHTGFTGTSLWIDPVRAVYVVFLTNRVYPDRENVAIRGVRPALHTAVLEAVDALGA